jgi:hypothetical protein
MVELAQNENLAQLFSSLLSDTVFIFSESVPEDPPQMESWWTARLSIDNDKIWNFSLCVDPQLAPIVSANLLGVETDSDDAQKAIADAIGELANILAGSLAVEVYGTNTICRVGIPEVALETSDQIQACWMAAARRIHFVTDEGQHVLLMLIEGTRS